MTSVIDEQIVMWANSGLTACEITKILQRQGYELVCKDVRLVMASKGIFCHVCGDETDVVSEEDRMVVSSNTTTDEPETTSASNSKQSSRKGAKTSTRTLF